MVKIIHKTCDLQVSTLEATALVEKVINEVRPSGTYKIDRIETEGAYSSFMCTPVRTLSLYYNSFVPDIHIIVYENKGSSQICFNFTLCKSVKFVDVLTDSLLLLFAVSIVTLVVAGKCDWIYGLVSVMAYLLTNIIASLMFYICVLKLYNSIISKMRQVNKTIK